MPDRTFPRHVFEVPCVSGSFRNISVCICRYAPVCFGAKSMLLCPMSACLTYSIWILFIRQSRFHSLWPAVSLFSLYFFYFSSLQLTSCDFYLRFVLILSNQKRYSYYYNSSFVYISHVFIAKVCEMQY